ncbi:hypothetical protein NVV31_07070 [Cytobacillus firmus]|uniref:hypothetical protein n=1 Tax=Cytobacillus firmus TaxID=1399 RepID=UPI0021CAB9B1|nr:hypothetical protein [Cytobacillus firmus]MCU1805166.1 hypothetical protein [Cytobacillus firmus]
MSIKSGFYSSEDLSKKLNQQVYLESIATKFNNDSGNGNLEHGEVIHFLERKNNNHKLKKSRTKITKIDIKREDELGDILSQYQLLLDCITGELNKGKESKFNRFFLTYAKGRILDDMTYTKESYLGMLSYAVNAIESTEYDFSKIDLKNPKHIKSLLQIKVDFDPSNDLYLILLDLDTLINKCLDTEEKQMILMLRNGRQIKEIAEYHGLTQKQGQRKIEKICKKIAGFCP